MPPDFRFPNPKRQSVMWHAQKTKLSATQLTDWCRLSWYPFISGWQEVIWPTYPYFSIYIFIYLTDRHQSGLTNQDPKKKAGGCGKSGATKCQKHTAEVEQVKRADPHCITLFYAHQNGPNKLATRRQEKIKQEKLSWGMWKKNVEKMQSSWGLEDKDMLWTQGLQDTRNPRDGSSL